jgi:transposase
VIGSTRQVSVYAYGAPCDMRKQYDSLAVVVREQLGRDVLAGDIFLFVGRDRKRAKVLYWDGTGLCVFAKRLEKGHFAAPWRHTNTTEMRMTMSELTLLLEGSEFVGRLALSPPPFVLGDRVVHFR